MLQVAPHSAFTRAFTPQVRIDTRDFSESGVALLDLTITDTDLGGFASLTNDGDYLYLIQQARLARANALHHRCAASTLTAVSFFSLA